MTVTAFRSTCLICFILLGSLTGCALPGGGGAAPNEYLLRADFDTTAAGEGPVLLVARPRAGAGYDTPRMIYYRQPNELHAYARNRWAGTPARMLEPLLVDAMTASRAFAAVVSAGSGLGGDLRLDTELLHLEQDFSRSPSRVRVGLRAALVESGSGRVLFARRFEAEEPAPGDDPESGAEAANRAVKRLLTELADAVADSVRARN